MKQQIRPAPEPNEIYRHFKGHVYPIIGTATDINNKAEQLVVYHTPDEKYFARPLSMFLSDTDKLKYPDVKQKERFKNVTYSTFIKVNTTAPVNCHVSDVNDATFSKPLPKPLQIYSCIDERMTQVGPCLITVLAIATHTETAESYTIFSRGQSIIYVPTSEFMTKTIDKKPAFSLVE